VSTDEFDWDWLDKPASWKELAEEQLKADAKKYVHQVVSGGFAIVPVVARPPLSRTQVKKKRREEKRRLLNAIPLGVAPSMIDFLSERETPKDPWDE